jgi:hypothetical protein
MRAGHAFVNEVFNSIAMLFLLLLLRTLLRKDWLAAVVWILILSPIMSVLLGLTGPASWLTRLVLVLVTGITLGVLRRFGLVAAIATNFSVRIFSFLPITFHASAFFSSTGYAALAVLAAMAVYGLRISLGSHPIFDFSSIDAEAAGKG